MPQVTLEQALQMAIEHHRAHRLGEAQTLYRQILAVQPTHPDALHLLGLILAGEGQLDEAERHIRQAMGILPGQVMYAANMGRIFNQAGQAGRALPYFQHAVGINPDDPESWLNLAQAQDAGGDVQQAMASCQEGLRRAPNHAELLNSLGLLFRQLQKLDEAQQCFERALAVEPLMVAANGNLGGIYELRGMYQKALDHYAVGLRRDPNHFMLHYNVGVSLSELGRYQEAVEAYRRAIQFNPRHVPAYNNLGNAYKMLGRFDEAVAAYEAALKLEHKLPHAHSNLAAILSSRGEHAACLAHDRQAVALRPDHAQTYSNYCYTMVFQEPFDTAAIYQELAEYNRRFIAPLRGVRRPHENVRDPRKRLKIGFVSPDLRDHVVARNLMPAFKNRDRQNFELYCYYNLGLKDQRTQEIKGLVDHWRDVAMLSDEALEKQIRADGIDILVDLALHMAGSRLPLFGRKPAPVQVTFAGYPGSTGVETIDYRFTDAWLDTSEGPRSVEKAIHLPSFWCYDPLGAKIDVSPLPAARNGYVTFGCLNHFCKVTETVMDLWIEVMREISQGGGAKLMLLSAEGSHRQRIRDYFAKGGLDPSRIEFYASRPRDEYLAWYQQMDLSLDTVPYNGHTTSLDSLWMGVPVVTLVGPTEVGRAGLSQLSNLGVPELVTRSPAEWRQVTQALAKDTLRLADYRHRLRPAMEKSVLMDAAGFAKHIEHAFRGVWERWCADNPT